MSDRPPRDLDWVPDDSTGIAVPSQTKQNAGWIVEKPARQFFNWMWNRLSRWTHYFSGQSQEWIVIDSANANEKDYDTLADYIADAPAVGDKVLVKESQTVTIQTIIPSGITLKFLDGALLFCSTNIATSVLKLGTGIVIEGSLSMILSQTGTTAKAVELNSDHTIGHIFVQNASTGTLTTAFHINANKTGNQITGFVRNDGGGTLTNVIVDNSTELSNSLIIVDEPNNIVISTGLVDFASAQILSNKSLGIGTKIALGSDADGDIYYRDAGILKRLAKGSNDTWLKLVGGIPAWSNVGKFLGGLLFNLGSDADGDIYYRDAGILKRLAKGSNDTWLKLVGGIPAWSNVGKFLGGLSFNLGSDANGDIYYRDAGILKRLAKGTDGKFLKLISGIPAWNGPAIESDIDGTDEYIAAATGITVSSGTTLVSINFGTVNAGERIMIHAGAALTKTAGSGFNLYRLKKSAGTSTVIIGPGNQITANSRESVGLASVDYQHWSIVARVTATGSLTILFEADSLGGNSTANDIYITAYVMRN